MVQTSTLPLPKARLVVKHTFLEFVNASPNVKAARDQQGVKTDSFLPEYEAPLPNEPSWALPNEPSGLSDHDTEIESCCGCDDDDWDCATQEEAERSSEAFDDSQEGSEAQAQREASEDHGKSTASASEASFPFEEPSAAALHALPAMTAAAAAAALEAASASPEVLLMFPPQGPCTRKEVISVADALDSPASKASDFAAIPDFDPADTRTTVMLRNLPNNYTRSMLIDLLEREGFAGQFDFLYLPIDFRSKAGLGYAFVNLTEAALVPHFWKTFAGYSKWVLPSAKVCHVSWSGPHQGRKAHLERYRNSPIMHNSVPDEFKPVVFSGSTRINFPGASKKLRAPRRRS